MFGRFSAPERKPPQPTDKVAALEYELRRAREDLRLVGETIALRIAASDGRYLTEEWLCSRGYNADGNPAAIIRAILGRDL